MKHDISGLEPEQLDALAAVDVAMMKQVAGAFLETGRARVGALVRALEEEDWVQVHGLAHSLKGSASAVGARRLAGIAGLLEKEAGHERPAASETTEEASKNLESEFQRASSAIERYLSALEN